MFTYYISHRYFLDRSIQILKILFRILNSSEFSPPQRLCGKGFITQHMKLFHFYLNKMVVFACLEAADEVPASIGSENQGRALNQHGWASGAEQATSQDSCSTLSLWPLAPVEMTHVARQPLQERVGKTQRAFKVVYLPTLHLVKATLVN